MLIIQSVLPVCAQHLPPSPALSWARESGAESCINSIRLAKMVEDLLNRPIFFSASEAELNVEGYVQPKKPTGFSATLLISDKQGKILGSRQLSTDQKECSSLDDALALVIAVTLYPKSGLAGAAILPDDVMVTLDAMFASEPTEPEPPELQDETDAEHYALDREVKKQELKTELTAATDSEDDDTYDEFSGSAFVMGGSAQIGSGMLPGANLGFQVWARYRFPDIWPIAVSGTYWFPNEGRIEGTASGERTIHLFHAGPSVCPFQWQWRRLSSLGCMGFQFGMIRAKTEHLVQDNRDVSKPVINFSFDAHLKFVFFGHVYPRLGISAMLPIILHQFQYSDSVGLDEKELFYMTQLGLLGEVGLEVRF